MITTTANRIQYTANGTTTAFSFPYKWLVDSEITVLTSPSVGGVETTKTINTDYTLSGVGLDAGGTVTFLTAPANTTVVTIYRTVPLTQDLDLVPNAALDAASMETRLDRHTMAIQQLNEVLGRCLKVPMSDSQTTQFTTKALRADKVIGFDSSGNIGLYSTTTIGVSLTGVHRNLGNPNGVLIATGPAICIEYDAAGLVVKMWFRVATTSGSVWE